MQADVITLLNKTKGLSIASAFRGAVFEIYAINAIESGEKRSFKIQPLLPGSVDASMSRIESYLEIPKCQQYKLDKTKLTEATQVSLTSVTSDKPLMLHLVPGTPTIDAICIKPPIYVGLQMTVAHQHVLDYNGACQLIDYFDSIYQGN
jgi:hypothetical protein